MFARRARPHAISFFILILYFFSSSFFPFYFAVVHFADFRQAAIGVCQ